MLPRVDADTALRRAEAIGACRDEALADRLYRRALSSRSEAQRVVWMYRAMDTVGPAVASVEGASPCRAGCSHCCHIPVLITAAEARALARASGAPLERSPAGGVQREPGESEESFFQRLDAQRQEAAANNRGEPCPFLGQDGLCGVYEARPSACRLYFSLENSPEPCDTGQGGRRVESVVRLDTLADAAAGAVILGRHQLVAEIRSFFPKRGPT